MHALFYFKSRRIYNFNEGIRIMKIKAHAFALLFSLLHKENSSQISSDTTILFPSFNLEFESQKLCRSNARLVETNNINDY